MHTHTSMYTYMHLYICMCVICVFMYILYTTCSFQVSAVKHNMIFSCTWEFMTLNFCKAGYLLVYTHMHMYIHMYGCMDVCNMYMYVHTYINIFLHTYMCKYIHWHMCHKGVVFVQLSLLFMHRTLLFRQQIEL